MRDGYMPTQEGEHQVVWSGLSIVDGQVFAMFEEDFTANGYKFLKRTPYPDCEFAPQVNSYTHTGRPAVVAGAYICTFTLAKPEADQPQSEVSVLVVCSYFHDEGRMVCFSCVPVSFLQSWLAFHRECDRLAQ